MGVQGNETHASPRLGWQEEIKSLFKKQTAQSNHTMLASLVELASTA